MIIKIVAGLVFTIVPVDKVEDFIDGVIVSIDLIFTDPRFIFGVGEWNVASFKVNFIELVKFVDDLLDFIDWAKDRWENRIDLV